MDECQNFGRLDYFRISVQSVVSMYKLIIVFLSAASLSGCFSTVMDAASLVGSGVNAVGSLLPSKPNNSLVFDHDKIKEICIELNRSVAISDFVPSLQAELQQRGVLSRVYETGTQPTNCPLTIGYNAFIQWDVKAFSSNYSPYMTFASLTLRREGRVVGSAQYRIGSFGQDKWGSTSSKLAPLVEALVVTDEKKKAKEKEAATFTGS